MSNQPLNVSYADGKVYIVVGGDTLLNAIRYSPYMNQFEPEDKVKFTDKDAFLKEIVRELDREEEDGTTLVHRMFDMAAENAIENGAEGIEWP